MHTVEPGTGCLGQSSVQTQFPASTACRKGCAESAVAATKRRVRAGIIKVACRQALQQGGPTQTLLELLARPF